MKTIKVSRQVMDRILRNAKPKESRDQTLGRLLRIDMRRSFAMRAHDGNVRTTTR